MKKNVSVNHNHLYALINNLDEIEVAILMERIYSFSKDHTENAEEFRQENKHSFINPDLIIDTMEKIYKFLDSRYMKLSNN
jgi:hypothetical protein